MNIETGQFLRLQVPARPRVLWLSPAWAVLCGLIASRAFGWTGRDVLIAALAVIVADGAWATTWWGLVETDWRGLLAQWRAAEVDYAGSPLTERGSPADRSQHGWARLGAWWPAGGREAAGTPLFSALFAAALAVLLSVVIGGQALALSLAALAVIQIALILRLLGRTAHVLQGGVEIALAWGLGHSAFGPLTLLSAATGLIFAIAYAAMLDLAQGASSARRWLLPQLLMVGVLIALPQPGAALALSAVLVAQALLATVLHSLDFARAAQFWLMLAMLIAALGIR